MEMFLAICWSYGKWCVSIVGIVVSVIDHSAVKVGILAVSYKSISCMVQIFSGLKCQHVNRYLR